MGDGREYSFDLDVIRYAERQAFYAASCWLRYWRSPKCEKCSWRHLCEELASVFSLARLEEWRKRRR